MALEHSDALFPDSNPLDQNYQSFISAIRTDRDYQIYAKSAALSYDFLMDRPFLSTQKIGFILPREMRKSRNEIDGWSHQAQANSTDSEEEIPEIPPYHPDKTSFRNDEIGNKDLQASEEGEEGSELQ